MKNIIIIYSLLISTKTFKQDTIKFIVSSEKIAYEIADDDLAKEALLMAEEKVIYLKAHKKK